MPPKGGCPNRDFNKIYKMNKINNSNSNRCLTSFALQTSFDMTMMFFEKKREDIGDDVANVFPFPPLFKKTPVIPNRAPAE